MILINFAYVRLQSTLVIKFLFLISLIGFTSLIISSFIYQKDLNIIFSSIFIVSYIFLLAAFLNIIISISNRFSFFKTTLVFFVVFVGIISYIFLLVLNYTDDHKLYESNNLKANAGIILGAAVWGGNRPSPVLKERINKGFEIYNKRIVPNLVITGGGSPNEMTEADVSKNVLIKYGVNPDDLILENISNSTIEQIHFIRDNLYNTKEWSKIILISDNFHLFRALEICKFNNINAHCISSDKPISTEGSISYCLKESLALIFFWIFGI